MQLIFCVNMTHGYFCTVNKVFPTPFFNIYHSILHQLTSTQRNKCPRTNMNAELDIFRFFFKRGEGRSGDIALIGYKEDRYSSGIKDGQSKV